MRKGREPGPGFEALIGELEAIVDALGDRELDLDEALALFEKGVARLREAAGLLDRARGRVEELIESASGDLAVVGFESPDGPAVEGRPEGA